jgi:hypothetical protein
MCIGLFGLEWGMIQPLDYIIVILLLIPILHGFWLEEKHISFYHREKKHSDVLTQIKAVMKLSLPTPRLSV